MSAFRARIGRIRMKSGGADIHVIERPQDHDGESWQGKIIDHARMVAGHSTVRVPLAGFVVLGIYADGTSSIGFRYDDDACPIPRSLLPAWTAEVLRRDMITEPEAESKFNHMFYWQDGF